MMSKTKNKVMLTWSKGPRGDLVAGPLPKHYWKKQPTAPPWSLEAKAREAEQKGQKLAAQLVRLYSYRPLPLDYLAQQEDYLAEVGLDPVDCTPKMMAEADHIIHASNEAIREWILSQGGSYNGTSRPISPLEEEGEMVVKETKGHRRTTLFGFPITAVLRFLGVEGWSKEDARKAMDALEIEVADATIAAQLRAGANGERGFPAKLTDDQINRLYDAAQ